MAQSIFDYNSAFKNALRKTKFRIDAASKANVEIFGKTWYENHFAMGRVPHMLSDFDTVLGKMHLTIAASTINGKSAEPLRMNEGFGKVSQKMFTHAHAYKMEADEIRELLLMAQAAERTGDSQAVEYITDTLFDHTREAVKGVRERIDLIILEALSNGGSYTFSKANDPQSPFVGQTIKFGIPDGNSDSVGGANTWTDAHKATVDPIKVIDEVCKKTRVPIQKILLDRATMLFMLSTSAMKSYINSTTQPNLPITLPIMNHFLEEYGLPTLEVVEKKCLVQDGNQLKDYTPWKAGALVFLPENQIGTIETRFSDAELGIKSEGVSYTNYGRIELRRMTVGEKENSDFAEIIKASITAAPSMDTANNILVLDTQQ